MTAPPRVPPDDQANQELLAHVRPPGWTNPTPTGRYNLVVIGAGPAGLVTAAGAAGLGARVALVERHLMGGDCLNTGCVPSKALISAARRAALLRDSADFGVTAEKLEIDFATAARRMRQLRADLSRHDSVQRFTSLGVDVFLGQASFTPRGTVEVGGTELPYHSAVIATGARAAVPAIPGLEDVPYLTNESLFSLTSLPPRLIVIGAGPIGCEMAQCFARFGSQVTVVTTAQNILPREDPETTAPVKDRMTREGVRFLCQSTHLHLSRDNDGTTRLALQSGGQSHSLTTDAVLVAVGRTPNLEGLNLEAVGVQHTGQGVSVDDCLRTTNRRIFACGDICSRHQFTHHADFMARIVIQNALFFGRKKASALIVPRTTYTSPEIAHVGLSPQEARDRGLNVTVHTQPLSGVDRAVLDGETEGFVRVVTRQGSDKILGATIVAEHAGDLISELTLAMTHGLGLSAIASTLHPYPTQAEAIRKAADQYSRTRLTPGLKKLFTALLKWRRQG